MACGLLCHQPVWMLRASQASLVNKCWVDMETVWHAFLFKFFHLRCHLLLFLCLYFHMPWHSLNISFSVTFRPPLPFFFSFSIHLFPFLHHTSQHSNICMINEWWGAGIFIPLLCFNLHKRSKFVPCGPQPAREVVKSRLLFSFCM